MKNNDNIQSRIDTIIKNINSNNQGILQEDYNDVKILIYYSHCLDLFDFLGKYFRVQLNETLIQIAIIYDKLGDSPQSLEYVNESLNIIPNVPSIILFKSGLFATMNRFDEAQKYMIKYKYLIGEDIYGNYIYSTIRIVYYYLLEYEENIILREISIVEKKFPDYFNNVIINFIKSKILHKLSEKFQKIDKARCILYETESIQNKELVYNNRKIDADYLYERDINRENVTKIIIMINPNFTLNKPKALVDYNFKFHSGFGLFFTLFEIIKIIKLNILKNKYKKINKNYIPKNNSINKINIDNINNTNPNENLNNSYNKVKEYQESILSLSKSVWLTRYINSKDSIYTIKDNQIKEINTMKDIDINNINYKLKTNYYIYNGYYSTMNLKDIIINNFKINNDFKEIKEKYINEFTEVIQKSKNKDENQDTITEELNNLEKNKYKIDKICQVKLVKSKQKMNKMKINKDKTLRIKTDYSNNNLKQIDKEKDKERKKYNLDEIIINTIILDNKRNNNKKVIKKDLTYKGSYKSLTTNNNIDKISKDKKDSKDNKDNKDNNIKDYFEKNIKDKIKASEIREKVNYINKLNKTDKTESSVHNIFNSIILFGNKRIYSIRNIKKSSINNDSQKVNEKKNTKNISKNSKEKKINSVKRMDKKKEIYNEIKDNNIFNVENKNSKKKKTIYVNNSLKKIELKDIGKYFIKKDELSKSNKYAKMKGQLTKNGLLINKSSKQSEKKILNKNLSKKVKKRNQIVYDSNAFQSKLIKKDLYLDKSPFNTISIKDNSKNKKTKKNDTIYLNYKKMYKNMLSSYKAIKSHIELKPINLNHKSESKRRQKEKEDYLTINYDSLTKINTPTYKNSIFSSQGGDSKEKNNKSNNKNEFKKIDINTPNYMIKLKRSYVNSKNKNKNKLTFYGPKSSF